MIGSPGGDLSSVRGTLQTARDWSGDFDNLQGIPPDQETVNGGQRLKVSNTWFGTRMSHTSTALGISATFTGGQAQLNVNSAFTDTTSAQGAMQVGTRSQACAFADQAGTLRFLILCISGGTFRTLRDVAVLASTAAQEDENVGGGVRARVDYVNGGTAQGTFEHSSSVTLG